MPRLTVITPNKNHLAGLKLAAESLEKQTFQDWEHLVIDAVSTDGSVEYAADRPRTRLISEQDRSIEEALNKGVRLAEGKYVTFLLCWDRYVDPGWLQQAVDFLEKNPECSLVSSTLMGSNGTSINYHVYPSGKKFTYYFFLAPWTILQDAVFVCRRSVLAEVFPQFMSRRDDCDIFHQLWINFFGAGYLAHFFTNDVLESFQHPGSRIDQELANGNWKRKEHAFYENKRTVRKQILQGKLAVKFKDAEGREIGRFCMGKYLAALFLYKTAVFTLKKIVRRKIPNFKFIYAQALARRCLDRVM